MQAFEPEFILMSSRLFGPIAAGGSYGPDDFLYEDDRLVVSVPRGRAAGHNLCHPPTNTFAVRSLTPDVCTTEGFVLGPKDLSQPAEGGVIIRTDGTCTIEVQATDASAPPISASFDFSGTDSLRGQ
ncbi:MAG: hypothetical protein HC923_00115 [Myxococcales bacterium]|nr:hypothetical protein [Myxococcales bacterium]